MTSSSPSDPSLQSLLARNPELNGHELAILLRDDQSRRWARGERLLVEHYQAIVPRLAGQPEALLDLIYAEFLLREGLGEAPAIDEYLARFPDLAAALRRQFAFHRELLAMAASPGGSSSPESAILPPRPAEGGGLPLTQEQSPDQQVRARQASGEAAGLPTVPGYELLGVLGKGGMGVVYKAVQTRAGRVVGLKMMLAGGHADADERDRFTTEAEAVARLQHPNVVQIFEVGEHDGLPFFSMEFCEAGSLKDKLADEPLAPREAAALVEKLAVAMEAAHRVGVIHRDLKPANVLLVGDGTPKVTDFGLARKLDEAGRTATGAVMGTPSYMAPEQASGETQKVGPAADVYALGAVLYECLTGRPPFRAATSVETLLQVIRDEPVRVRQLQPGVPRDLETVCLKCLHKEPMKRYESAAALAADLRRFQDGEPIAARPAGRVERAARWARRRPAVAALLLAVVVLTAAGVGAFAWAYGEALHNEGRAKQGEVNARQEETRAKEEERKANAKAEETRQQLAFSKVALAASAWNEGEVAMMQDRLDEVPAHLRNWEWRYLKRLPQGIFILAGHTAGVRGVAFSPDGTRLATASEDLTTKVWDARTGRELLTLKGHTREVSSVAFSPDGTRLATGSWDKTARVWDARTGQELLALRGHKGVVTCVAFSPDGTRLATGSWDKTARVWDARTGQELLALHGHEEWDMCVAFSPDGARLATGDRGTARVWDARTGQELLALKGNASGVNGVAFSPDGTRLATASSTARTARVWDARTGQELLTLGGHASGVNGVAFSPDGTRLATVGGRDWTAKVWDAGTGQELLTLKGHTARVTSVAFSPDGTRLATGDARTTRVWDARTGQELLPLKGHTRRLASVAFSPDGTRLATSSEDLTTKVWDARTGRELLTLKGHTGGVTSVAFSPDGTRLATGGYDRTARVWDARTGQELFTLKGLADPVSGVAFSPDGTRLATASWDKSARVWEARPDQELLALKGHTDRVTSVAFSPDGSRLATASRDTTAKVWDALTGQEVLTLKGHKGYLTSVAFSSDGSRLATASEDMTAKVWDALTGQDLLTVKGHKGAITSVAFGPDGSRLATGSWDTTARVWDARTGQELLALKGHSGWTVTSVAFSPDGSRLGTGDTDGTARVWDVLTGQVVPNAPVPAGLVHSLLRPDGHPSPDGHRLALISGATVRLMSLQAPDAWEIGGRMWNTRFDPFWHLQQATRPDLANNHDAQAFHRELLLAASSSRAEHVSPLLGALAEVVRQSPEAARAWRRLTLAQLFAGQSIPAERTCSAMRQRFTVPGPLCQAAQGFRVAPHDALAAAVTVHLMQQPALLGVASDFDRFLTARTGVMHPQGLPEPLLWLPAVPESEPMTRAALLCRAGEHAEAIDLLQALKEPRAHLWRALAEHGRGDKVAARRAFDEALAEMERVCPSDPKADATPLPWEHRAEYEILKREVQALLKE